MMPNDMWSIKVDKQNIIDCEITMATKTPKFELVGTIHQKTDDEKSVYTRLKRATLPVIQDVGSDAVQINVYRPTLVFYENDDRTTHSYGDYFLDGIHAVKIKRVPKSDPPTWHRISEQEGKIINGKYLLNPHVLIIIHRILQLKGRDQEQENRRAASDPHIIAWESKNE